MVDITCVVDARAELGEGTLWDPKQGVLWWIDIWSRLIHRYDPATGEDKTWEAPHYLGCIGLRASGGLVLDSKAGWSIGGDSGPAIVPGDADRSLLWHAVNYKQPKLEMPPAGAT